jgi:predicted DsbA family dithiol-disulfide isomerase
MKIEVWSDIVCPFCYIGKRKLEEALRGFQHGSRVKVEWKSYQLAPNAQPEPNKSVVAYLAERKRISEAEAKRIYGHVTDMAKENGIAFNLEKAVICNTFNAHRLSHLARSFDLQNEMAEKLFAAYFTEGKDLNDLAVLAELGVEVGLPANIIWQMLYDNQYAEEVSTDIAEASLLGVQGVPFFVFDRKYAISGAQPTSYFVQTLEKAWAESLPIFRMDNVIRGNSENADSL